MKKIEVGCLAMIVNPLSKRCGHIGKVLRPCSIYPDCWDIEGAEHSPGKDKLCSYSTSWLRRINPDAEPADESFHDMIKRLNRVPVEIKA